MGANTASASHAGVKIAIVMGSKSDWANMQFAAEVLTMLDVRFHAEVVSAHRTPDKLFSFAEQASANGFEVIIAGAGGAAHLPGILAAKTLVPVLGVPVQSAALSGIDSLCSIVQMPRGIQSVLWRSAKPVPPMLDCWRHRSCPCTMRRWHSVWQTGVARRPKMC